jgi:hypothetical protein
MNITWTSLPPANGWSYERGTLDQPASSITLNLHTMYVGDGTELIGLNAAGQAIAYCTEAGGQLLEASGCALVAPLTDPGYALSISEPTPQITSVIAGAYNAVGAPGVPGAGVGEPAILWLCVAAVLSFGVRRTVGRRSALPNEAALNADAASVSWH